MMTIIEVLQLIGGNVITAEEGRKILNIDKLLEGK